MPSHSEGRVMFRTIIAAFFRRVPVPAVGAAGGARLVDGESRPVRHHVPSRFQSHTLSTSDVGFSSPGTSFSRRWSNSVRRMGSTRAAISPKSTSQPILGSISPAMVTSTRNEGRGCDDTDRRAPSGPMGGFRWKTLHEFDAHDFRPRESSGGGWDRARRLRKPRARGRQNRRLHTRVRPGAGS